MTEFASILPAGRTPFEAAIEEAVGRRIEAVPVPIRDMDDPLRVVPDALPFIAWARSVGIWDDEWPEWLKRKAVNRAVYLRQRGGSLEAYEGWLDLLGAEIVDTVIPPIGSYATKGQTQAQRRAFLRRFAELRITLRRTPGPGDVGTFYASRRRPGEPGGFVGLNFAIAGTARLRYGRRATIVDQGVETEVLWSLAGRVEADNRVTPVERIVVPGKARPSEPFVGALFVGGPRSFAERFNTTSRILTLGPDRAPQTTGRYPLVSREANPLEVLSITPERVSERSETAARPMVAGGQIGSFAYPNTASERYYDRFYLFDPDRVPHRQTASYGTFVGYSRAEATPFRAELRISYPGQNPQRQARVGGVVGVGMFPRPSSGRLGRIANAVRASKSARDKVFFTAQTKRLQTLEDGIPLDGSFRFGNLITIARGSS